MERTVRERLRIGFDRLKERWASAEAVQDRETLKICGHPVMERWETGYMEALAEVACRNGGRVLEVGFGMGISAGFVQRHAISEHVIIEANAGVFENAKRFARSAPRPVALHLGFWEEAALRFEDGSFDGILFDTNPLAEEEIHSNHFPFFREAHRLLKPGGMLTYYSDERGDFSEAHLGKLKEAGFDRVDGRLCRVEPPADCRYWDAKTILVPIITK